MADEKKPRTLHHGSDYREHRADAYPVTGDALDAIAEGFRALAAQGFSLPPKTLAWLATRDAVKVRFVKPKA